MNPSELKRSIGDVRSNKTRVKRLLWCSTAPPRPSRRRRTVFRSYNPLEYVLEGLVLVFTTKYERMKTSFSNVHAWFHGQAVVYSLEQNQKHTKIHTTLL